MPEHPKPSSDNDPTSVEPDGWPVTKLSVEKSRQFLAALFPPKELKGYVDSLFEGEIDLLPENEGWDDAIERLSVPGRINEISEDIYFQFLEVLPPKLMRGPFFAFAEGQEPLRVFLRQHERFLGRQLTQEETDRLCDLTGLPKNYGSY